MNRYAVTVWIEQQYVVNVDAKDEQDAAMKVHNMSIFDVTIYGNRTSHYPVHNVLTVDGVKLLREDIENE